MPRNAAPPQGLCTIPSCDGTFLARGFCTKHYNRWAKHGDPLVTRLPRVSFSRPDELKVSLESRRRIDEKGCWLWTKSTSGKYGQVCVDGAAYSVHRVAACVYSGFDINSPLLICHRCDVRLCFNPDHLFPGTVGDNAADMVAK